MNIVIRKAAETDYPTIIAALKEFAVFQKTPVEKVTNTAELMKEEQQYFTCFIAEDRKGTFMGMATCSFAYYSWTGKALYLDDLYVKEAYRKQGIGKRLFDAIFTYAKQENCKKIHWMVSNWNNNAIEFYKSAGASFYKDEYVCYVEEQAIDKYIENIRQ